jgi:putative membrane protein
MVQHLLLTLVAPPLLFYGIPPALLRRILQPAWLHTAVRSLARPLVAAAIFNAVTVFVHWPAVVDTALRHEPVHFSVHLLMFSTALLMWFPVLNRVPELPQLSYPGRMVCLFLQSVIPTVPASFLTFADGVIYKFYATVPRPWHVSAVSDQQVAGAIMKIIGAAILWSVILVLFFRWYAKTEGGKREDDVLTWADVERELQRTPPAPSDH